MSGDPLGYRTTLHWCIAWTCGHTDTPVADEAPRACSTCGCTEWSSRASYPFRVDTMPGRA